MKIIKKYFQSFSENVRRNYIMSGIQKYSLKQDVLKDITGKISDCTSTAVDNVKILFEGLSEISKDAQVKFLKDAINSIGKYINEAVPTNIEKDINKWVESPAGITKTIQRIDGANDEAIQTAVAFENKISDTIKDKTTCQVAEINHSTAEPTLSEDIFMNCVTQIQITYQNINEAFENTKAEFDSCSEENVIYSSCSSVVASIFGTFIGVFSHLERGFENMAADCNIKIGKILSIGQTHMQTTFSQASKATIPPFIDADPDNF